MIRISLKLAIIGALSLLLLIPTGYMCYLNKERQQRRDDVSRTLGAIWGYPHSIAGPVLVSGNRQIAPEKLNITLKVGAQSRHKGIFELPVYSAEVEMTGIHRLPAGTLPGQVRIYGIRIGEIEFSEAEFGGSQLTFAGNNANIQAPIGAVAAGENPFRFKFKLLGTRRLHFYPVANHTEIEMESNWPHPNFSGSALPIERSVSGDGFKAKWQSKSIDSAAILNDANNENPESIALEDETQSFGVDFFVPVDIYSLIERAVKYSCLFISLTFLLFFIFETVEGLLIHPVQYMFVGLGISLFFLLLLSLAEHVGFNKAYLLASGADIALISGYCISVLKSRTRTFILTGILIALYAFLYVLLQLEKYSLLAGSLGLFAILGGVMYATRNIDWYGQEKKVPA